MRIIIQRLQSEFELARFFNYPLIGNRNMFKLIVLMLSLTSVLNSVYGLEHPSVFNTQEELNLIAFRVNNEPLSLTKLGWDGMMKTAYAKLDYAHKSYANVEVVPSGGNEMEDHFRGDAQSAYSHALQWVVTGNPANRDKAIIIMNDWAKTLKTFTSTGFKIQIQLECAWASPIWIAAADIIRYHNNGAANWSTADINQFDKFLDLLYTEAEKSATRDTNWGSSATLAMLATGAYQNNETRFNNGVNAYKNNLTKVSSSDGKVLEVCRDTWHPQYCLVTWQQTCEIACKNGIDLYDIKLDGQTTPRLVVVLEYFSKLFLGKIAAPCASDWTYNYTNEKLRREGYETGLNHYANRKGLTSQIANLAEAVGKSRPGLLDDHFISWGLLTHGDISKASGLNSTDILLNDRALLVYPNPSNNGQFQLSHELSWEVYSALGLLLTSGNSKLLDISNQSKGLYLLKTNNLTKKIVVQ